MTERERTTQAAQDGRSGESSSLLPRLLASTAAASAYLALLGGSLLAIRFWHAGLSVTQAVSAVPLPTLITTALIELFIPAIGIAAMGVFYGLMRLGEKDDEGTPLLWVLAAVGAVAVTVPFNLYGAALFLTLIIFFAFVEWGWPAIAAMPAITRRRTMFIATATLAVATSLPVLARQLIEPLEMERVTIERPGRPALIADLVAIHDTSIVVARCHHLIVLPMPQSMRIEDLPNSLGAGASITEKLGINSYRPVKPQPMPC